MKMSIFIGLFFISFSGMLFGSGSPPPKREKTKRIAPTSKFQVKFTTLAKSPLFSSNIKSHEWSGQCDKIWIDVESEDTYLYRKTGFTFSDEAGESLIYPVCASIERGQLNQARIFKDKNGVDMLEFSVPLYFYATEDNKGNYKETLKDLIFTQDCLTDELPPENLYQMEFEGMKWKNFCQDMGNNSPYAKECSVNLLNEIYSGRSNPSGYYERTRAQINTFYQCQFRPF